MKKLNKIILTVLFAFMTLSWSESFFRLNPNDEVTTDKLYQTESDFNIAVIGCYSKLQSQVNYYLELCEYRSDNLFLNAPTAGTQDRYDIDHFQEKASNGILENYWANFNNNIYRCNLVLDKIDNASFDENMKSQFKGEALFIRALSMFNMYRIWGGVTVARKVLTPVEALTIKRCSDAEMYNYMVGDLEEVVNELMLPESYSSVDAGRATLGAAQTLLAKIYLTFGEYDKAANLLAGIIGKYTLLPNIESVFDVSNKMNDEVIFAVRFNKSVQGEGHGYWYSISNLSDDTGQTNILKNLYTEDDNRKMLIEYEKVPVVNVYLMLKFYDTPDVTCNNVGNESVVVVSVCY